MWCPPIFARALRRGRIFRRTWPGSREGSKESLRLRRMKSTLVVCLIFAAAHAAGAGEQARGNLGGTGVNTWAARSSTGLTLGGTWTATEDAKTGAVTGTWTLVDTKGRVVRRGAWSAAKAASGWTGSWRAIVEGTRGEYAGTWTASVDLQPGTRFADMFAKAMETAVSGTFRAGRVSGSWTIRASVASE